MSDERSEIVVELMYDRLGNPELYVQHNLFPNVKVTGYIERNPGSPEVADVDVTFHPRENLALVHDEWATGMAQSRVNDGDWEATKRSLKGPL